MSTEPIPGARLEGEHIREFALAGKAILTLRSVETGTRFTYKITANDAGTHHFVKLLAGSDNEADYRYIGFIRDGSFRHGGAKSFAKHDAPGVVAVGWFVRNFLNTRQSIVPARAAKLEVWHEGHCGRCGRRLTVPESIETGLGPECAKAAGVVRPKGPAKTAAPTQEQLDECARIEAQEAERERRKANYTG